jgi:hypothetical protein
LPGQPSLAAGTQPEQVVSLGRIASGRMSSQADCNRQGGDLGPSPPQSSSHERGEHYTYF